MGRKRKQKNKKKNKEVVAPEEGSFKYGMIMGQNPIGFYHSRLEMLKRKRMLKRQGKREKKNRV